MTSEGTLDPGALMKRSLLELRKLRARVEELEGASREPIAIVGLGCRFPGGAHDPDAFWDLLLEGRDAIVETPATRLELAAFYDPDPMAPGKSYACHGGFLDQVDSFDAHFFGISHPEAMSLDPQQRMLLEVTWEALEHAAQAPDRLYGTNVGVFVGISSFEWAAHLVRSADTTSIDPYFGTGTALSAAAGRLSFTLGLTGPSMAIDTACSSSLVALHVACQSLRRHECDLALAGGVNVMAAPEVNIAFSKARLLAPDGRCKTFDAAADGYVRGEGCGVVVLKRLADAVANRDHIVALIRGSAVNQDGPSGALVVPNGLAQEAVIRTALENAGVAPDDVDCIEAHGTGTALGDPIELSALGRVFGNGRARGRPLLVSSVKTNVGHLESAAGAAGLIKIALSLQHETIPAHLHFQRPNPRIPWDQLPLVIPTAATPWPRANRHRFAGLSSFGFTGTNAHVVLEEAPVTASAVPPVDRPVHVLTLTARTSGALRELASRFAIHLTERPDLNLRDVCFSANTGRARLRERLAIVASSVAELRAKLEDYIQDRDCDGLFRSQPGTGAREKTVFVFTGAETEYPGIGRELYDASASFREAVDRGGQVPRLVALEVALAELWQSWGIHPTAVVGFGESVAARDWSCPVRESDLRKLHALGCHRFLEIGPESGWGSDGVPAAGTTWIGGLRQGKPEWRQIAEAVAALSVQEPPIDWVAFDRDYPARRVPLPTYPFERQRFWSQPSRAPTDAPPDVYYRVAWEPYDAPAASMPAAGGTWLILADRGGIGRSLAARLETVGAQCIMRLPGQPLDEVPAGLRGVVHLWALDDPAELEDAAQVGCGSTLQLVQAFARHEYSERLAVWLVTRGSQAVVSNADLSGLRQTLLWGLGKSIGAELPWLRCTMIDLDPAEAHDDVTLLFNELGTDGDQVAFRGGRRYESRLVRAEPRQLQPAGLRPDRTYLITGGLGGVGMQVARWMAETGARYLALLGRSDPTSNAADDIEAIRRTGAEVAVLRADVSRANELASALELIAASMPTLAGIIHCAGTFNDRILVQHEWDLFAQTFAPKVRGAWNLHTLTLDMDLDFFVLFSSAAAMLPSPGMSSYVAANTFQDALAEYRCSLGLPALSIGWGPWQGTGMAQRAGRSRDRQWRAHGVEPLAPARALEHLGRLLIYETGHVGVFSVRWADLLRLFSGVRVPPYLERVGAEVKPAADSATTPVFRHLLDLRPEERPLFLEGYLKDRLVSLLGDDGGALSTADNLPQAGVDSLMMMDVLNSLRDDLRFMVYPREFYEQPTIQGLARYLASEFERAHGQDSAVRSAEKGDMSSSLSMPGLATEPASERLPTIVFVLSAPRSGSTLLRVMLAGHQAVFAPPELHLLPFASMAERARILEGTHLGEGLQRALMVLLDLDADASAAMIHDWVRQDLPVRQVYAALQQHAGSRLLVDKSPSYAASRAILDRAEGLFRGARYIHLVRHPYAMIESFVRMRMDKLLGTSTSDPHVVAEQIWTTENRNILDTVGRDAPDRYHRIAFEDLVRDPQAVMTRCCEFLGVPFDAALLRPYSGERMTDGIHSVSAPVGDPNFLRHDGIDPRLGERWREIDLDHRLKPSAKVLAAELGYELDREAAAVAPRESYLETVRGLRLCLCHWGTEGRPLVMLLHGILEQGAAWMAVAPILAEQGFQVIAPDLRGHGRSDHVGRGGSYQLMDFAADIDAIAAGLAETPFTLVGHSMGSVVAALFAAARPAAVRSLVLVEPPILAERGAGEGIASERLTAQLDYLAAPPTHPKLSDLEAAVTRIRRAVPALSHAHAVQLAERNTRPASDGLEWRWDPLLGTRSGLGFGFDQTDRARYLELLRNLRPPTTLVFGSESTLKPDVAGMDTAVIPGGHNLHLENPVALAEVVAKAALRELTYEAR